MGSHSVREAECVCIVVAVGNGMRRVKWLVVVYVRVMCCVVTGVWCGACRIL